MSSRAGETIVPSATPWSVTAARTPVPGRADLITRRPRPASACSTVSTRDARSIRTLECHRRSHFHHVGKRDAARRAFAHQPAEEVLLRAAHREIAAVIQHEDLDRQADDEPWSAAPEYSSAGCRRQPGR